MRIYDIIDKKAKRGVLSDEEIGFAVNGFVKNEISPAQMSSLLMAIRLNGMNMSETYALTKHMQNSGKTYHFDYTIVDKHSTGGVGDSTTMLIVPILASLGIRSAKMSGKALGLTGGTADKMSVFSGYKLDLNEKQLSKMVEDVGGSIITSSDSIAVADKMIYNLRDQTATVESIPLIASSIMSKKLASGSDIILLDVKYGRGAFMKTEKDAIKLAKTMIEIGRRDNKKVWAVIDDMNTPLSFGIGSAMEVYSALKALQGDNSDLCNLSIDLSAILYQMATNCAFDEAKRRVSECVHDNSAYNKFIDMVEYNGGNKKYFDDPEKLLDTKYKKVVKVDKAGYVIDIDAMKLASIEVEMRDKASVDRRNFQGLMLNVNVGDYCADGKLATIYSDSVISANLVQRVIDAFKIGNVGAKKKKYIKKVIK